MQELIFIVKESEEGGYTAKGLSVSIFTEAETIDKLKDAIKDAIKCHFEDEQSRLVRLHWEKEEVFIAA